MSCYESEKGSWTFPTKNWKVHRDAIMEASIAHDKVHYEIACAFYEKAKGLTLTQLREKFTDILAVIEKRKFGSSYCRWERAFVTDKPSFYDFNSCRAYINFQRKDYTSREITSLVSKKPNKPKKSDMPKAKKFGKDNQIISACQDELYVKINNKTRTISIEIYENNHACDTAWATPLGKAVLKALRTCEWTGNNGGYSIYRSEYDESYEPSYNYIYGGKAYKKSFRR